MKQIQENWLPIQGTDGSYEVSDLGQVRSVGRVISRRIYGDVFSPGRILAQQTTSQGYKTVGMCVNGRLITQRVHRLVAQAFIPNPGNKPTVNHKFGIKSDNRATELEWATSKEQTQHALSIGLMKKVKTEEERRKSAAKNPKKGEEIFGAKLTEEKVREIKSKYKPRVYSMEKLAQEYGVNHSAIKRIFEGISWKHVR